MNSAKLALALLLLGGVGTTALPGLSLAASDEPTRTVSWYMAPENKEALDAKIKECRDNPGKLENSPNCINAEEARYKIRIFKPPMQ